jgi:hypothetical protein
LGIAPELDRFYTEAHITWVEPVWEAIGDRSDPVSPNARNAAFSDDSHARAGSLARMT